MAKRTKLSEFEKGKITALKRVRKSRKEIVKALGHNKTMIWNYLKSPNKYGTRMAGQKNSREELFMK